MLSALWKMFKGAAVVTNEEFTQAVPRMRKHGTAFLLEYSPEKLSYRVTEGEYEGMSYAWYLAHDVCYGRLTTFEKMIQNLTLYDLRTKPLSGPGKDKTLLWVLCLAATLGHSGPLTQVLDKFKDELTDEDYNATAAGRSVRYYLDKFEKENNECDSAETLQESSNEPSETYHSEGFHKGATASSSDDSDTWQSEDNLTNNDDGDALSTAKNKTEDVTQLRMYSHRMANFDRAPLAIDQPMSARQAAKLRKKQRQNNSTTLKATTVTTTTPAAPAVAAVSSAPTYAAPTPSMLSPRNTVSSVVSPRGQTSTILSPRKKR